MCAILSEICVYSRFAYLRPLVVIDAKSVAEALVDVFLDLGVVPLVLQSDQGLEFMSDMMAKVVAQFGSKHVFSSAFHTQSQGIVERARRTMAALLGSLMETPNRDRPRRWPRFIRVLEARLRDKTFGDSGLTPRGVVQGWFDRYPVG